MSTRDDVIGILRDPPGGVVPALVEYVEAQRADERAKALVRRPPMSDFERWWAAYWKNRTDTVEHTISRSIAYDAWWAARRNARGDT